jgi:hypothetical protein
MIVSAWPLAMWNEAPLGIERATGVGMVGFTMIEVESFTINARPELEN